MALRPALIAALAGAAAAVGLDDAAGLVQLGLRATRPRAAFNCTKHRELCQEPFNCQDYRGTEPAQWAKKGVGNVIFKQWCEAPQYGPYMSKCVAERDPVVAAKLQFALTKAGLFGDAYELDGSYCFLEGHCVNQEVDNTTTWQEAVPMCDRRFGPKRWRNFRASFVHGEDTIGGVPMPKDGKNGFTSRSQTTGFLIAACAMGNFHCDVMYCKATYCKDPYFTAKYGHLLKEQGWVS